MADRPLGADPAPRAFVTGWPVSHSRSPMIHGHWLQKYGLRGAYVKHPCTAEDLAGFLTDLADAGFVGGNVTIPHKEAAFALADHADDTAKRLGAANTVWLHDGALHVSNTDGYGFAQNLAESVSDWNASERLERGALVLGAGGAARAIVDCLKQQGFSTVYIANRTLAKANALAAEFGSPCTAISMEDIPDRASNVSLIVNTTSLGMEGTAQAAESPVDLSGFSEDTIVNDIVYTPLITPLLKQATKLGMTPVDGLGMLLHQAVPGFERWFGVRPEVTSELRALVVADLGDAK